MQDKKVRILVDGMCPGKGGVQQYLMNLYRNIDESKIQLDFIVCGNECEYEDEIRELGGEIYYITPRKENVFKNIKGYYDILRRKNTYDIVYYNLSCLYYNIPFLMSLISDIKIKIVHSHNSDSGDMSKLYYILHCLNRRVIDKKATYFFMCSKLAGEWLFGKKIIEEGKVRLVPNAIDTSRFKYDEEKSIDLKKKYNLQNKFVIGHIGRFDYQKNHNFIIDIFNDVVKIKPNSTLMLIGEGKLKNTIIDKVKKLGLEEKVIFLGNRDDIPDLLNIMDLFIFPSNYEGLGIVLIEAQATGLKCIVSDAVPKEACVTDNLKYLSLEKSSREWANEVVSFKREYIRTDRSEQIKLNGFEIVDMAHKFEEFIFKITKNGE